MNKLINKIEIRSNFDKFKIGLINRIINNYENTDERQQTIDKIPNVTITQAIKQNAFCKEILPILWDATPPQNEKDYCYNSHTVYIRIISKNKELRVRSYFHGNINGNPIKGKLLQSEVNKITTDNIITVIKESASREVLEESNIKLEFIDDTTCSLNIYNNIITGNYEINSNNDKHNVTIHLSSNNYQLLKKSFHDNLEEHKIFMENTGEISGLLLY
jgi:hypothetical protein